MKVRNLWAIPPSKGNEITLCVVVESVAGVRLLHPVTMFLRSAVRREGIDVNRDQVLEMIRGLAPLVGVLDTQQAEQLTDADWRVDWDG